MTVFVSSKGIEKDLDLDIDRVCQYEQEHPDWGLVKFMVKYEANPRLTDMALLTYFMGFDSFQQFIDEGFSFTDLTEACQKASILGFMTSGVPGAEEAEPEEADV